MLSSLGYIYNLYPKNQCRGGTSHPSRGQDPSSLPNLWSVRPSGPRVQGLCRRLGYQENEAFGPFPGRKVGQQHPPPVGWVCFGCLLFFFGEVAFLFFCSGGGVVLVAVLFLVLSQFLCIFFFWHLIDPYSFPCKLGKKTKLFVFIFCKSEIYQKVSSIFWLIPWPFFSACFLFASRGLPKAVPFSITSPNGTVRGIRVTPTKISHRVLYLHGSLERQNGGRRFAYQKCWKQGLRVGKVFFETLKLYKYATMELCNYKVIIGGLEW